jgi:uncharacterized protein YjbI with pentapeptide repeats
MASTRKLTWFEKQKIRKKNPFFRLLNRSFSFRLLIASAISLGILGAVHRFEVCHAKNYSSDCLAANLGDIISVGNVESFSIVAAAWLYILESSKRKQQKNLDALDSLSNQQAAGIVYSLARIEALETANETGVYLDNLNLQGANLEGIEIPYARLQKANLSNTILLTADLRYTDLKGANLSQADLTKAKLIGANLTGANLNGANLTETDLTDANLTDVDLSLAHLENAILPTNR